MTPALEVYTTLRLVPATQYGQDQIKAFYAEVRGEKRPATARRLCSPEGA